MLGLIAVSALVAVAGWLVNRGPTTPCADGWPPSDGHAVLASKVVALPWFGRHNVYGVFVIPPELADSRYSAAIRVRGVENQGAVGEGPIVAHEDDVAVEPGEHLLQARLMTRTALQFLVTGRFGDLRNPCNWALILTERPRRDEPAGNPR